jgi:hypothetical protein
MVEGINKLKISVMKTTGTYFIDKIEIPYEIGECIRKYMYKNHTRFETRGEILTTNNSFNIPDRMSNIFKQLGKIALLDNPRPEIYFKPFNFLLKENITICKEFNYGSNDSHI